MPGLINPSQQVFLMRPVCGCKHKYGGRFNLPAPASSRCTHTEREGREREKEERERDLGRVPGV